MAARIASNVCQAAKAAAGGVGAPTLLTRAVAGAKDVGAGNKRPTTLTLRVPLTELLRGGDVSRALLLLLVVLTTPSAAPLGRATPTTSTTATPASAATAATTTLATAAPTATSATTSAATSASTAATSTSTPATTPTATPTPHAAPTSSATAPASSTRSLAPLALARAAPTAGGRRRTDRL
ncbi:unnamed protein product [Closterium sp. NIES-64]|nr:unnamed protein product [Closterium sp. NIES-64]